MFQVGSWHYDKGGTDLFVKTISHWLAKRGHKVVVLAHRLQEEDCENEEIKVGKGIIKVRYTKRQKKGARFNPFVYAFRLFETAKEIYLLSKKEKIEIIVVGETELLSVFPLKFTKTKIFCRGGALLFETMKREVYKERGKGIYSYFFVTLLKIYNLITLKLPDFLIPVNESEYVFLNAKKRKNAKIQIIPHGVDISLFRPLNTKRESKVVVGYVGRLAPIKYPETAMQIFKESSIGSRDASFLWIGPLDPSYEKDFFEKLKKENKVNNAKYLGRIENSKLPNYLNKFDIFFQVEQQTNVSRSTTEAAACGLPVVALNKGKEPYGFFSMNKSEVIKELKRLIEDKNYRIKMGKRSRKEIVENFSEDKIYSKYLDNFIKESQNG